MKRKKKKLSSWIREHKKEIAIAGVGIAALIAVALLIKNQGIFTDFESSMKKDAEAPVIRDADLDHEISTVENVPERIPGMPSNVRTHIRTLPAGQHASAGKIAEAEKMGIHLNDGQTLVDEYIRGQKAA